MAVKKSITIKAKSKEIIDRLDIERSGRLLKHIMLSINGKESPEDDHLVLGAYNLLVTPAAETPANQQSGQTYKEAMEIYDDFCKRKLDIAPKIDGRQGKAMKELLQYLKSVSKTKDDRGALLGLSFILENWDSVDRFYATSTTIAQISSNIQNIIISIRKSQKGTYRSIKEEEERLNQILNGNAPHNY